MTTLRFTENQVTECGYDFSDLGDGELITCAVRRRTLWDDEADMLVTELTIERLGTSANTEFAQ